MTSTGSSRTAGRAQPRPNLGRSCRLAQVAMDVVEGFTGDQRLDPVDQRLRPLGRGPVVGVVEAGEDDLRVVEAGLDPEPWTPQSRGASPSLTSQSGRLS